MTDTRTLIGEAAHLIGPYDRAASSELARIANLDMHPKSAMRRVRALADAAKPAARRRLHDLADDLGRMPAGPEDIDVHAANIRAAIGQDQQWTP